jgi:serine/threonine protein kinase
MSTSIVARIEEACENNLRTQADSVYCEIRVRNALKLLDKFQFKHIASYNFDPLSANVGDITLQDRITSVAPYDDVRITFARKCICVMYALHYSGLLHRTLSMQNFSVSDTDNLILDGLETCACVLPNNTFQRSYDIEHIITPEAQTAPELSALGSDRAVYGFEVDIWLLGKLLYTLISGQPYSAVIQDDNEIWNKWTDDPRLRIYAVIVRSAISPDPLQRPTINCIKSVLDIKKSELCEHGLYEQRILWNHKYVKLYEWVQKNMHRLSIGGSSAEYNVNDRICKLQYDASATLKMHDSTKPLLVTSKEVGTGSVPFWVRMRTTLDTLSKVLTSTTTKITERHVCIAVVLSEIIHSTTFTEDEHIPPSFQRLLKKYSLYI